MSLNDLLCKSAKPQIKQYKILDKEGLYLQIMPSGSKYWRYRFYLHNRQRTLAIGKYPIVSLSEARERRNQAAKEVELGKDPILLKSERKQLEKYQAAQTFEEIATEWHQHNKYKWSTKHSTLVKYRLTKYLFAKIGRYPIAAVTPQVLLSCLQPVEATSAIVARRLLQYVGKVLQYAQITGRLTTPDFTAGLKQVIRTPKKGHFASIEIEELPKLLEAIYQNNSKSRTQIMLALKMMLLTFVRTSELIKAEWQEIDFEKAMWIIPPERMKMKLQHLVPLSSQAIAILKELKLLTGHRNHLFPSISQPRKPMSNMALLMALRRMGYEGKMTGHGFRSLAMGIGKECLEYPHHVIDRQLAHVPQSDIVRAYDRAKYLPQRIKFMQAYSDYLEKILLDHQQKGKTNGHHSNATRNKSNHAPFPISSYSGSITYSQYQPVNSIAGREIWTLPAIDQNQCKIERMESRRDTKLH